MGKFKQQDEVARERLDLGKPRWILRSRTTHPDGSETWSKTWLWCPRCLARRDPMEDGIKYIGGYLWTWIADVDSDGKACKRHNRITACTCELGQYRRRCFANVAHKPVEEVPDASFFPPTAIIGPYIAEQAKAGCDYLEIVETNAT